MSRTQTLSCPACGKSVAGNFCSHCGEARGGAFCTQCGAEVSGRFCSRCGTSVTARAGHGPARTPPAVALPGRTGGGDVSWWIAGGAFFALVFGLGLSVVSSENPPLQAAPPTVASSGLPDLSGMTPRQAADQLFNYVMTASDNRDAATVAEFMPLALQAYEAARPLDLDGLFHLAMLQRTAGDSEASLQSAEEILAVEPNHILGLNAAAEASLELGQQEAVADYYQRVLDHLDAEMIRPLPEYQAHARYFAVSRQDALEYLASR